MRWLATTLRSNSPSPYAFAAILLTILLPTQTVICENWETHADTLQVSYGLRIGSSGGPAYYDYSGDNVTERRLGMIGAEVAVRQGNFGQIGVGMDLMIGPRSQPTGDPFLYSEHIRYSAIFFYVSPGIQVRLGRDQPLSIGASVDIGPMWSRETAFARPLLMWDTGAEYLEVERILAIRPSLLLSYNVTHSTQLQFEYGWMHGKIRPSFYLDLTGRPWYAEFPRDYDGPYFIASIAITRPVKRKDISDAAYKSQP